MVDYRLELVQVPVSDVDRAKAFYTEKVGFNADHDHRVGDEIRFVQLTPPGSACSIALGTGIVESQPGSVQGVHLVVSDINAARAELAAIRARTQSSRVPRRICEDHSPALTTATPSPDRCDPSHGHTVTQGSMLCKVVCSARYCVRRVYARRESLCTSEREP